MTVLTSRMAAALDALVEIAQNADELDGVVVVDGTFDPANAEVAGAPRRLFIGSSDPYGEDESLAVDGDQAFRTLGGRWRDETFTVRCIAEGWNGQRDLKAARDAAVATLAAMERALRPTADMPDAHTLAGAVAWAGIGQESITSEYNDEGVYVRVDFAIQCRANLVQ